MVQYWGYTPGKGEWKSSVQKTDSKKDNSPAHYAATRAAAAPSSTDLTGPGFVCSLFVSNVYRNGGRIQADTLGQCSGSFDVWYQGAQFKRDSWLGWQNFSDVMTTPWTTGYTQDWTWWRNCGSGGTYN